MSEGRAVEGPTVLDLSTVYARLPERESALCSRGHVGMARGVVWSCGECGEVWRWPGVVGMD